LVWYFCLGNLYKKSKKISESTKYFGEKTIPKYVLLKSSLLKDSAAIMCLSESLSLCIACFLGGVGHRVDSVFEFRHRAKYCICPWSTAPSPPQIMQSCFCSKDTHGIRQKVGSGNGCYWSTCNQSTNQLAPTNIIALPLVKILTNKSCPTFVTASVGHLQGWTVFPQRLPLNLRQLGIFFWGPLPSSMVFLGWAEQAAI
jgi:hypothetical protein